MKFSISSLHASSVWTLYKMRDRIQLDPQYQRQSDVWTLDKRQLLIDTLLNEFDVPKIYLHKFEKPLKTGTKIYDFAIIDGKQRLETLWSFLEGKVALADDFKYFKNSSVNASGMKYAELGKAYPDLKNDFDTFLLAVIVIETDEVEMIEEMFSRLNEAVPLTAAEKRNSFGGPLPVAIKKLATETFFKERLPFSNLRYRHFDLAAKFLLAEHEKKVMDTKKEYLDGLPTRRFRALHAAALSSYACQSPLNASGRHAAPLGSGRTLPSLFGLAPCGVYPAAAITACAVRSYRTFSPLPDWPSRRTPFGPACRVPPVPRFRGPGKTQRGGMFSVALAVHGL